MRDDLFSLLEYLNPENIIYKGGLILLMIIIFAETGVFFGFFLPGDSLLFVAGLLSGSEYLQTPIHILIVLLVAAAVSGSTVGYFTGRWASNYLYTRKENFFFKKKYLTTTEDFYKRYGMMAFIAGRFLPIIRTFVTILAGIVRIDFPKFLLFNFIGAAIWVSALIMAGHWLGNLFPWVTDYLELVVVGIILISTIPALSLWFKRSTRPQNQE